MSETPVRIPPLKDDIPYEKHWSLDVKDKVILDIGADRGSTADYFLCHGAKHVIAVEGHYQTYLELEENSKKIPEITPVYQLICCYGGFEELIKKYKPDLVKVDIEGGELHFTRVDAELLRSVKEYMFEVHYLPTLKDLLFKFVLCGYAVNIPMMADTFSMFLLYAKRLK